MHLVEDLKRDLQSREEFDGATVEDKLGAALPTRRPYDSAVAPGFVAAGDAAGLVNPTTGGGIGGAAYSGQYAGEQAIAAIEDGDVGEDRLWEYNKRVMDHFGARFATLDVYNIFVTAYDIDSLMGMLAALPAEKIAEGLYAGETDIGPWLKLKTAVKSVGHWGTIYDLYETKQLAERVLAHYEDYPETRAGFADWQVRRDEILDDVYATTGADPKY